MKTVLLTGGAGFIGSHLAHEYHDKGYKVVVVDNLSSGKMENISDLVESENFFFYNEDIRNIDALRSIFEEYHPNIVNHHAAQKSVPYSMENPLYDVDLNIKGILNIINLVIEFKTENLIFISSGGALSKAIVGDEKSKESDMPSLLSPYAITKFAGENYVKLYAEDLGFKFSILRYSNVYGPKQIADGECGVVPIFVNNVLNKKESILMTYDDMPRGCTRDYVFVSDIIDINMIVSENPINDTINIGSGKEDSILDIYETILKIFNSKEPIKIIGPRKGDIRRSVLDNSKAKNLLGWSPKIDLNTGLEVLYKFIKSQS